MKNGLCSRRVSASPPLGTAPPLHHQEQAETDPGRYGPRSTLPPTEQLDPPPDPGASPDDLDRPENPDLRFVAHAQIMPDEANENR